jgi:hypothetical protein
MTKWARIRIRDGGRSDRSTADGPRLGVAPTDVFGTSKREHARITREAADAATLVTNATPAQARLLQRLAAAYPSNGVCFPFVATLERFLAATASLDEVAGAALDEAAVVPACSALGCGPPGGYPSSAWTTSSPWQ